MKKNTLGMLLSMIVLAATLTACGSNAEEATVEPTPEAVETVVEEVEEPEVSDDSETNEAETATVEEIEETEEFTGEMAMEKVQRLILAYDDLMSSGKDVEYLVQDRCEKFIPVHFINEETSDGVDLNYDTSKEDPYKGAFTCFAVGQNYYWDYVNNGGEYYDFAEYITSHTADEILYAINDKDYTDNTPISEKSILSTPMMWAIKTIPNLLNHDITANTLISIEESGNTYDIPGYEVAYELPILIDGEDIGLVVLFDKEGNLLNIDRSNVPDGYVVTTFNDDAQINAQ